MTSGPAARARRDQTGGGGQAASAAGTRTASTTATGQAARSISARLTGPLDPAAPSWCAPTTTSAALRDAPARADATARPRSTSLCTGTSAYRLDHWAIAALSRRAAWAGDAAPVDDVFEPLSLVLRPRLPVAEQDGGFVASLDRLGKLDFGRAGQQRHPADLLQIQRKRFAERF